MRRLLLALVAVTAFSVSPAVAQVTFQENSFWASEVDKGNMPPIEELITQASRSTHLEDFGSFDGDWRSRFESLCESLERDAQLNTVGRLMCRQELQRGLCTRLLLTERRKQEPAIEAERVVAPLIITGPARSGTSILFELIALDPNARGVLGTEAAHPVPSGSPTTWIH